MPRNYNESTLVYVTLGTVIKYVFRSRLRDSLRDNLGQTVIAAALTDVTGYIVGANAPKPARATKRFTTGNESSFISHNKGVSLKNDGWLIIPPNFPSYSASTDLSQGYKITLNGVTYAYHTAKLPTGISIPGEAALRNEIDSNDDTRTFVWGAEFPKPASAKIITTDGKSFSTLIDPSLEDSAKQAGYNPKGGLYTAAAFNAKYLGIVEI